MNNYVEISKALYAEICRVHLAGGTVYNTLHDACDSDTRKVLTQIATNPQASLLVIETESLLEMHQKPRFVVPESRANRRILWIF